MPSSTACAPTTSATNGPAGDCCWLFSARLIAQAKFAAVTGLPFENLNVFRSVKVYVFPSVDTVGKPAATSGTSRDPAEPSASAKRRRLAPVAPMICQECV